MGKWIIKCIGRMPRWLPTVVIAAAIAYLTLARFDVDPDEVPSIPHLDKMVHFVMFGSLAWIAILDWAVHRHRPVRCRLLYTVTAICAVASSAAGAAIEIAQGSMHMGRSADPADWVADTIGAVTGAAIAYVMVSRMAQSQQQSSQSQ